MDEVAALLKDEAVQGFLKESEKLVRTREGPHVSESKSVCSFSYSRLAYRPPFFPFLLVDVVPVASQIVLHISSTK